MRRSLQGEAFVSGRNDSVILQDILRIYGSIFVVFLVLFCVLRRCFPRTFAIRTWVVPSDIAQQASQFGFFSWTYRIFSIKENDIFQNCGMDAICLLRQFEFGCKLCLVGMLNSLFLLPLYATTPRDDSTDHITDHVARMSISAVPAESKRLIATVVSTYIVFIATMLLILREFKWFAKYRHRYLSERVPRNYSVYISGIPSNLRNDPKLASYFDYVFTPHTVVNANIHWIIPKLQHMYSQRQSLIQQIEHQINIEEIKKVERDKQIAGGLRHLKKINQKMLAGVSKIEKSQRLAIEASRRNLFDNPIRNIYQKAAKILPKEGERKSAGFVVFRTLRSRQAAVQMIHFRVPYALDVTEAPDPESLYYLNVGRSYHELQVGRVISIALTTALRIAWTVPTAFISSLGNLDALSRELPFIEEWIIDFPWLPEFFAVLAPLLLISFNSLLPIVLEWITLFELPLDVGTRIASQFPKLAWFMILQTFFVSAVSGSVWREINMITRSTQHLMDLFGSAFPGQSTYFIQILLVKTFVGVPIELLRIIPIIKQTLRKCLGPNLTEKERSRTFLAVLRPFSDPLWLLHAEVVAASVLYLMVFFVYSSTAPLVNWVILFCFGILYPCWRYQVICNYKRQHDTGGRMWISFMWIVRISSIISQLTLWAILALKRFPAAIACMLPLLVANLLFNTFLEQRHGQIARYLPSADAVQVDDNRQSDEPDFGDAYIQPPLLSCDELLPDNMTAHWREFYSKIELVGDSTEHTERDLSE